MPFGPQCRSPGASLTGFFIGIQSNQSRLWTGTEYSGGRSHHAQLPVEGNTRYWFSGSERSPSGHCCSPNNSMIFPEQLKDVCGQFGVILEDGPNAVIVYPPIGNVLGENYQHSHEVWKRGEPEEGVVAELIRVVSLGIFPCENPECGLCR